MPMRPTRLKTAAMAMATLGGIQRVETTVAMALGASVTPEMAVTPKTKSKMMMRTGLAIACSINAESVNDM